MMPRFNTLPDRLIALDASSSARLLQLDLDGRLLDTLDPSNKYDSLSYGTGAMGRVYFGARRGSHHGTSACPYALVEWTVR